MNNRNSQKCSGGRDGTKARTKNFAFWLLGEEAITPLRESYRSPTNTAKGE